MKTNLKPSTCLAPVPVVLVSCGDERENNIITIAWAGTVNSEPPTVSISVRYSRHSLPLIERTGEFTVNLVSKDMLRAADLCGVVSGRNADKFALAGLNRGRGEKVKCPYVEESPAALECKVVNRVDLGTHAVFFGEILNVIADEAFVKDGKLTLPDGLLLAYRNGHYIATGEALASYGFTAKEKKA